MVLPKSDTLSLRSFSALFLVGSLSACGGGSDSSEPVNPSPITPPANVAPVADAGIDQGVDEETIVTLSGSGTDSDGSIASYRWAQSSGSSVTLSSNDTQTLTFTSPTLTLAETLVFELTVTDDDGATHKDAINVVVNPVNISPTVTLADNYTVFEQTTAELSGVANDEDGSIATYAWTQVSGDEVTITNAGQANASFISGDITAITTYEFSLTVTDNEGAQTSDNMIVTVDPNYPPVAVVGDDLFVSSDSTVTLDGSASSDLESGITYLWTQLDETAVDVALLNATSATASFVANDLTAAETVTLSLTVTDEGGLTDTATMNVAIAPVITEWQNDTGISLCGDYAFGGSSNHSNSENCADTVDVDADTIPDGQDADYGRDKTAADDFDGNNGFTFTKLDENGDPLAQSATNWSCVLDNVTGLIWEVKQDLGSTLLRDANNMYTWYNSTGVNDGGDAGTNNGGSCTDTNNCDTEKFVSRVNTAGLCGLTTWRMPTKRELNSLVDFSVPTTALDVNYFPNTKSSFYWSSTPNYSDANAWRISFSDGNSVSAGARKSNSAYIRLVSVK